MITVIIPTRNRPGQIKNLLASMLAYNTYHDFETLIVDDNSSEENKVILQEIITAQPFSGLKLKCIYSSQRKHPAGIRNLAVRQAQGEILYFIDDDCEFRQDNLWEIAKIYAADINQKLILGGENICSIKWLPAVLYNDFFKCSLWMSWKVKCGWLRKIFIWGKTDSFFIKFVPALNMACKRDLFKRIEFNEAYRVNEDEIFCNDALRENYKILFTKRLRLAHNHLFGGFSELLARLTEMGRYYRRGQNLFRKIIFMLFYPWALVLFTGKLHFIFHYATMSYVWSRPFLVKEN